MPQGSILGPILFIALTSDLVDSLDDCIVKAYADDTQLMVKGQSKQEVANKLEHTISKAQEWSASIALR